MFQQALDALRESDPGRKCELVARIQGGWRDPDKRLSSELSEAIPGRPSKPELVEPRAVPRRGLGSAEGRAALIHAVAHIEFNAINLALDAVVRFDKQEQAYYDDWLSVAKDEARHFSLLCARLKDEGSFYGAMPAHNGLWEAAEKTCSDVLERMALVPRVLEARGLDVTPGMILRLREVGDHATVAALELILAEEVRHVRIGSTWFEYHCRQRKLDPSITFKRLLQHHGVRIRGPLNLEARRSAGFGCEELATFASVCG